MIQISNTVLLTQKGKHFRLFCRLSIFVLTSIACLNALNSTADDEYPESDSTDDISFDESEMYVSEVHGNRLRPTDETTGMAEEIYVEDDVRTLTTVGEVLSQTVGVQVRSAGGLGSYGVAAIRGSTPNQVPIYLDGIQLNAGGFPSVDLGALTLDTLSTVKIYRDRAPVSLGASGIGGAISLSTRVFDEPISEVAATYGSWDSWRVMTLHGNRLGKVSFLAMINAQGAQNDFEFKNDNGTPNNSGDDTIDRRRNSGFSSSGTFIKISGPVNRWHWTAANDLFIKQQEIPGIGYILGIKYASLETLRDTVTLRVEGPVSGKFDLALDADYMLVKQDYNDVHNEIGVGPQRVLSKNDAVGGALTGEAQWNERNLTSIRLAGRYEVFSSSELVQDVSSGSQRRVRTDIGVGHSWQPCPSLKFEPAIHSEIVNTRFEGGEALASTGQVRRDSTDDIYWSPALGAKWEMVSGLFLRANGGRYVRAPDISELFGDSGVVVGNPTLDPEVGINVDAGLSYILDHRGVFDLVRLEAAWFASWVRDLIEYERNSRETIKAQNIGEAEIQGLELAMRLVFRRVLFIEGNYTYMLALDTSDDVTHAGKRLPGRPAHEVYGKVEAFQLFEKWGAGLWFDMDYTGGNYLRPANLPEDKFSRAIFGLGWRIEHSRSGLTGTVEVKNLFDTIVLNGENGGWYPMQDYVGFPLPGRTIFATLHWKI